MSQQTYQLYHDGALAGMVVENGYGPGHKTRGRYQSSENLNFGRILEFWTDGQLRQPQQTGANMHLIGGCVYNPALPPTNVSDTYVNGYAAGADMVPVLRKGQMWIEYTGTAPTVESTPNVCHASDDSLSNLQHRGKVTGSATSTTVGAEISAAPAGINVIDVDTTLSLALVEFNLPA